jgi:ribosomal protein S18 acetylase RimI-like enzyme
MEFVDISSTATEVRVAAKADAQHVEALLTVAFAADPIVRWMLPEDSHHLSYFPRMTRLYTDLAIEHGTAYLAVPSGGTAVWLPPGVVPSEEALGAVVEETVSADLLPEVIDMFGQLEDEHPKIPCWYLPFIGVDPAFRGQGLGAKLLAHSLAVCDRDHLPAYLEATSSHNIRLYERHGFRVQAEVHTSSSPPIVPMLRPAR